MYKILICDDEKEIVEAISIYLSGEGYKVYKCYNGKEALNCIEQNDIDLVIMDVMMPGDDGLKTTINIRKNHNMPIIILSAKSEDNDKILGLNIGADDYMTKPFNPLELTARVKSLIRRNTHLAVNTENNVWQVDDLVVDDDKKLVTIGDNSVRLTPLEYNILLLLIKNKGKVFSTTEIYREIWKQDEALGVVNTIAVHIRHLREKIELDSKNPKYIKVVWGVGYKIDAN